MRIMLTLTLLFGAALAWSQTAESVIAKHMEAKGGDAWNKVDAMQMTGTFTGFSIPGPFTLIKQKPNRLYMDQKLGKEDVEMGFDGTNAWWVNGFFGIPYAIEIPSADAKAVRFNAEFATSLFNHDQPGFSVQYEGIQDLAGEKAHKLVLTRPDGEVETWFLNPETFLEQEVHSDGGDFGQPVSMKTYFSDFREVQGLQIPFYVEWEFGTRYRVMEVAAITFDVDIKPNLFAMPLSAGMERLRHLAGTWVVEGQRPGGDDSLQSVFNDEPATIDPAFQGAVLNETLRQPTAMGPQTFLRQWSFDRDSQQFRITAVDEMSATLRLFKGPLPETGPIAVSTLTTEPDAEQHIRWLIDNITADGFTMTRETSSDQGESWSTNAHLIYRSEAAAKAHKAKMEAEQAEDSD